MLIHSASQLLTLAGGPQRGNDLGRLGIMPDGAVLVRGGQIEAIGASADLRAAYPDEPALDAGGRVVMPGFVDPHTHLVFAGDRAAEFELRLEGKTYLEILAAGGGILSTVRATRRASVDELLEQTRARAASMLRHGTTTAEAKTGYGLETNSELAELEALLRLDEEGPLEIAPTFLGAHAIAPEFKGDPEGYTDAGLRRDAARDETLVAGARRRAPAAFCGCVLRDRRLQPGADAAHSDSRARRWVSRSKSMPMNLTTWAGPAWQPNWARSRPTTW